LPDQERLGPLGHKLAAVSPSITRLLLPIPETLPVIHRTTLTELSQPYWYTGQCPRTGVVLKLPRTAQIEAIAQALMRELTADCYTREGKMYGVLLVTAPTGEPQVLQAFSGLLNGQSVVEGWVPPIPGRDRVALAEAATLATLATINQELLTLQTRERPRSQQHYQQLAATYASQLEQLTLQHQQAQRIRQQHRQTYTATLTGAALTTALAALDDQSRREGGDRRRLKQARAAVLQPRQQIIDHIEQRIRVLKQQRKQQSQQLQAQLYANYRLTNFAGESLPLVELMRNGTLPTGTGECCAPKLLHYAATHHLRPLAMAEFWWGSDDRVPGQFYGPCAERCQPLMGFLLSGLVPQENPTEPIFLTIAEPQPDRPLTILYEDDWLIVVDKPAGLLSVPGRSRDHQDSVLTRLQLSPPPQNSKFKIQNSKLLTIHRLDQDTSGILVFARDRDTHRQLQQQWQRQQVHKVYEAVLAGSITIVNGTIDLPLWSDPTDRPYQKVDCRGKSSLTEFRVLAQTTDATRVEFIPRTGRTHQLRVHAAVGLELPIVGDRLYGKPGDRLHLHARELHIEHPQTGSLLRLRSTTPF
jgi:tRNA pseudouridine32 synthase / 23S rRNA pseudouridine746 synthase